jgi:hypothetical protein
VNNFTNILLYLIGLVVFGFLYWLLNGILDIIKALNVQDSTTFTVYPFLLYVWAGVVLIYLVFGGIWLVRCFEKGTDTGGLR